MIHKQVLVPDRVRRPPRTGWSWIDRRFLRERAPRLRSDASIAVRLRMTEAAVVAARDELVREDLVAYRAPLVQVLSLPRATVEHRGGGLVQLGEMLRTLAGTSG